MQKTRTFKYLFPSLYYSGPDEFRKTLDKLATTGCLKNAYLGDVHYENDPTDKIFVLVYNNNDLLDRFFNFLLVPDLYIEHYEVRDRYYILVYEVKDKKAYQAFINSQYSEMYTIKYLKDNFKVRNKPLPVYGVLAKTEERRQELISFWGLSDDFDAEEYDGMLNMDEEIFNKENIWAQLDTTKEN